jgi:hypothetical protein
MPLTERPSLYDRLDVSDVSGRTNPHPSPYGTEGVGIMNRFAPLSP